MFLPSQGFYLKQTNSNETDIQRYCNCMSLEDQNEYINLKSAFHQNLKSPTKDKRFSAFSSELSILLAFTERSTNGVEERSIAAGIAFAGPYICVNTRQLKNFIGRCKSSLNGSFQQLGYVAVRPKQKTKACVLACLPSLAGDISSLRQWTVRYASADATCCFASKVINSSRLPKITESDLYDEGKVPESPPVFELPQILQETVIQPHPLVEPVFQKPPVKDLTVKQLEFDLSCFDDVVLNEKTMKIPDVMASFSMDLIDEEDLIWESSIESLRRSQSWFPRI